MVLLICFCALILISNLSERSVVSRFLQRTFWPTILSCDTTAERKQGVGRRVVLLQYLSLAAIVILAAAGVLTPVGLGERIVEGEMVNATFAYAKDPTVFGIGTPSRTDYTISRVCGNGSLPCPGVLSSDTVQSNDPNRGTMFDIFVAENITTCFDSGTSADGDLRASPFQIQFRQYLTPTHSKGTQPKANTTGTFALLENVFMDGKLEVREGVVIDAINGGIGFRNHTVPVKPNLKHGAVWTENLLWIEPETVCTDTNWTIEYGTQLSPFATSPQADATYTILTNRGMANGNTSHAFSPLPIGLIGSSDLDLHRRTLIAAQNFGFRLQSLIFENPAHNKTEGASFRLDEDGDYWLLQTFVGFGGESSGVQLGPITDNGNGPINKTSDTGEVQGSQYPATISLDPTQFNLSSFNVSRFFDYLYSQPNPSGTALPTSTSNQVLHTFQSFCKFCLPC
jgi:hypothetical protein